MDAVGATRTPRRFHPHRGCPGSLRAPPAAGDLDGWKLVDRRLGERLVQSFMTGRRPSDRAVAQYFGTARVGWPPRMAYT